MSFIIKFFQEIVFLVVALAIIGIFMSLWNNFKPLADAADRQAAEQIRLVEEAKYSPYDNRIVSGSQLVSAVRRYATEDNFYVYVRKTSPAVNFGVAVGSNPTTCPSVDFNTGKYSTGTMTCSATKMQLEDITHSYYVSPQSRYRATLLRDKNDRISGLFFLMQ